MPPSLSEFSHWATLALAAVVTASTLFPLIPTHNWVVRLFDFPRVQFLILALIASALALTLSILNIHRPTQLTFLALTTLASIIHLTYILPYTNLWTPTVEHADSHDLRLLITNIDKRNNTPDLAAQAINDTNASAILLIEINDTLLESFDSIRDHYPHRLEQIRDDGLGIALWSKHPIHDPEIKFLVSDRRASLHCTLDLDNNTRVKLVGLHPTPPALPVKQRENADERYDSDIRDAELVLVARAVAEHATLPDPDPVIVAGDFNDVAWSKTTTLFQKLSALRDPRVGRGLLNTYHAAYPPLRYPLDHIFLSEGTRINDITRIKIPGSDHFAVLAKIQVKPDEDPQTPTPDHDDLEDAQEAIQNGNSSAQEHNESSRSL